ncbi:PTS system cellobiose-specific IIA component [Gracilibacillus alcaliphilus]|nr:PTS system cellobiose-specific IIA component [Gracilibacillus alcaliphilus]
MEANEELQRISFSIILHAGNARSSAMEAIKLAKENRIQEAQAKMDSADVDFVKAHQEQSQLLSKEIRHPDENHLSIILVHAQDHLMNALTIKDLAWEMIEMYQRLNKLEVAIT